MVLQNIQTNNSIHVEISDKAETVSPQLGLAILNELNKSVETVANLSSSSAENRVAVGSRPLNAEQKNALNQSHQNRKPKIAQIAHAAQAIPIELLFDDPRTHFLASYSLFDNTLELEDGSYWQVRSGDMYKVLSWALNDDLTITPNYTLYAGQYLISNPTTGQSVAADLVIGPVDLGPNTHWVIAIDRWLGRVYLENGTSWDVRGLDQGLLSDWAINDTVILGDGANEWFGRHDSILINVNMDHYVYANRGA